MSKKPSPMATKLIRVDMDVAELAEKVASLLGKSVSDLLSKELRPILTRFRMEIIQRLSAENRLRMQGAAATSSVPLGPRLIKTPSL